MKSIAEHEMADRLNNLLTGIAVHCGVLEELVDHALKPRLSELHTLATEAVQITRLLLPNGD